MYTNPKKNRTPVDHILLDQFRRKGYKCEEIEEQEATIFIITHDRKTTNTTTPVTSKNYKILFKAN
jgi:hypothetical protein